MIMSTHYPTATHKQQELPQGALGCIYDLNEDIVTTHGLGLQVEDDRESTSQNIPILRNNMTMDPSTGLYGSQQWY